MLRRVQPGGLAGVTSSRPLYPEHPTVGNPLAVPPLTALFLPSALVVLVGVVVGAGSLAGRYRRARGSERLQLRWLALAALSTAALLLAVLPIPVLGWRHAVRGRLRGQPGGAAAGDRSGDPALPPVRPGPHHQPARRRIQQVVDRRFNRRRYDAGQTIAASAPGCASRST